MKMVFNDIGIIGGWLFILALASVAIVTTLAFIVDRGAPQPRKSTGYVPVSTPVRPAGSQRRNDFTTRAERLSVASTYGVPLVYQSIERAPVPGHPPWNTAAHPVIKL